MVELTVKGNDLHVEILGWDKLLGLKSSVDVPLGAIKSISATAGLPTFRRTDIRVLGTGIPQVMAVGTYWIGSPHRWAFLDLRRSSKDVVSLEIEGQFYSSIIVEVKNAEMAIEQILGSNGTIAQMSHNRLQQGD
ncbi:hypothetical protein [Candidatus Binatus sp.]|jgi:hypothetical protein|uniref:hypothetical protein n=1 Tax=Candidatus Binatus sp. TaxID=2811406 RepID=UPI003C8D1416